MSDHHPDLSSIDTLLGERDALHAWLAKLEGADVAVPERVRERVRADYQGRLDAVTEALRAHRSTIAERLAADRSEQQELIANATATREALAEAELRFAVGEFAVDRFEQERTRYASDLESYEISLDALVARISQHEDLEAQLMAAPTAAATTPAEPPAREEPEPLPDPAIAVSDLAAETSAPMFPEEDPAADGGEDFLSVFSPVAEAELPPAASPPPLPPPGGEGTPLSFTPSGAVPPIGMPATDTPRFSPPRASAPSPTPRSGPAEMFVGGMVPQLEEEARQPSAVEAQEAVARTVRCGECGAMNRPLEWYCEKCGAELTAV